MATDLLRTSSCLDCICFKHSIKHEILFFKIRDTQFPFSNVYLIYSMKFYEQVITSYQKFSRLSYGPAFFFEFLQVFSSISFDRPFFPKVLCLYTSEKMCYLKSK